MIATSAEKRFYDTRYLRVTSDLPTVDSRLRDLGRQGTRYFCLLDFLSHPEQLSAVEWSFGDLASCTALAGVFRSYHAVDISADRMIGGEPVDFGYTTHNLNEDLPFSDEGFDVSIAMMVIEHLFDPFHSFREIARTTKRGGHVFINLPLVSSIKNRLLVLAGRLPMTSARNWRDLEEWDGGHLHYFTIQEIKRLGAKYGLDCIRIYPVGNMLWLKRLLPSLLCHEASFVFRRR